MIEKNKFKSLEKIIRENNTFILTTHVNPDADAIGSVSALANVMLQLNKSVRIINHSETPKNNIFLDKSNMVEKFDISIHPPTIHEADVLIAADLNRLNRTVSMEAELRKFGGIKVCIDHHEDPEDFADLMILDTTYTSTGEIVYDFITSTGIAEINPEIAEALYAAIMTDTGSFRFDRTTAGTHRIIADLIENGAHPLKIYEQLYEQNKFSKSRLLGMALAGMELNQSGEICCMVITQEMLKSSGANEAEVDGFVNYCLSVEGVKIGLLFFELSNGLKISFRSRGRIAVSELAKEFGGGGHFNASGTRLYDVKLIDLKEKVLTAAEKYL